MKSRFSLVIVLVAASGPFVCGELASNLSADDGWRRTSQGWERIATAELPADLSASPHVTRIHPLLLACWQAAAGIGGLMLGEGTIQRRRDETKNAL